MKSVNLAKFRLFNKIFFINFIKKIYKKWLIDNYMISNKTNLIPFMITNLEIDIANHLKKSIFISFCQISKIDQPNKNDNKKILEEIINN